MCTLSNPAVASLAQNLPPDTFSSKRAVTRSIIFIEPTRCKRALINSDWSPRTIRSVMALLTCSSPRRISSSSVVEQYLPSRYSST